MIKITPFYDRSSTHRRSASQYFHEDFQRQQGMTAADYMAKGVGQYGGKLAERLGLAGVQADKESFLALEHNKNPLTGERLTARHNTTRQQDEETHANRRSGADACFIVPKSLSVAMAENPGRFRDCCQQAILEGWRETMEEFESLAMVRVRKGDREEDRPTGNLLYVPIFHEDARPVGSDVPDPYVHIHTFIFNATFDPHEGRIKALKETGVFTHAHDLDARFLARLEARLTRMGIGTERTIDDKGRQGFELTSVSREARDLFSKRHAHIAAEIERQEKYLEKSAKAIVRAAAKEGRHLDYDDVYAKQKDKLGVMTRQEKLKALGPEAKLEALRDQMTPEIRASLQAEAVMAAPRRGWLSVEAAQKEVMQATFKTVSAAHELKVQAEVLRRAGGAALPGVREFTQGPEFVRLNDQGVITSRYVHEEERQMRAIARQGWDQYAPLGEGNAWRIQDERVRDAPDQVAAVRFLCESRDLVMDVSGIAGAGKSTMLKEVVAHLEAQGKAVFLLAPTSPATDNLRGDGFRYVDTLQAFQVRAANQALQDLVRGQVIVVDESSMVSVPQMRWVLDYARRGRCRVILAGDSEQHHSVERGDAVRILEQSASVRSVELSTNYRARPAYLKAAVTDLWEGRKEEGWQKLDGHGDIQEVADVDELRAQAVEQHLAARRAGETSILACPIHAEARELTRVVRALEKAEGLIAKDDHVVTRIKKLPVEGLELRDPIHYQAGRVVAFHAKVTGGFQPGELWRVAESDDGTVRLCRGEQRKAFDPSIKGRWDLYESAEMELSVGDQIRVTEGFKENGVAFKNNEIAKVARIDGEKITLEDGRQIVRDAARMDQGVTITSYATECRSVDQIVPVLPMRAFAQVNDEAWYVLVSRARHRVVAFTDCKEALHEQVIINGDRKSVWEHERDEARRKEQEQARSAEKRQAKTHSVEVEELAKRMRQAAFRADEDDDRRQQHSRGHGMGMGM